MINRDVCTVQKAFSIRRIVLPAFFALLLAGLPGCQGSGSFSSPYPETEEGIQAKNLSPAPGKSLVYFYYSLAPGGVTVDISLDGAASAVAKNTFVVWEVDSGRHELQFTVKKWLGQKTAKKKITCKPDQVYFYNSFTYDDTSQNPNGETTYDFREAKPDTGRERIRRHRLMAWFRDGEALFRRDIDPTPQAATDIAETSEAQTTPAPEAESASVPGDAAVETPQIEAPAKDAQTTDRDMSRIQGRYYALVLGISHYTHLDSVPTARNDAQAVAEILRAYGMKVNTLLNEKATRERILDSLDVFRKLLEPQDKLLIYYAGRGQCDPDGHAAYWLPVDAMPDSATRWILTDSITASLTQIPAGQILVVADSCYSGILPRSAPSAAVTDEDKKPARLVITSGADAPVAGSPDASRSLFAQAFIAALTDAEGPVFSAEELFFGSLQEAVAGQSAQLPELSVIRNSGHQGGNFLFLKE